MSDLSDGDLLQRFIEGRDEAAFDALVRAQGGMVLGVCLRVLGNMHDAEDAFQATFLVLARKAETVQPRNMIGAWLCGVAYRTSLKSRVAILQRQTRERRLDTVEEPVMQQASVRYDWLPTLEKELNRLPDKYRLPVVLCDLEGKSHKEAASLLGCPEGTLSARLSRGRSKLAARLARSGAVLSVALLAITSSKNASAAGKPSDMLIVSTVKAASRFAEGQRNYSEWVSPGVVALTEGVLKSMVINHFKLKTAAGVVALIASIGVGGMLYQMQASEPAKKAASSKEIPESPPNPDQKTLVANDPRDKPASDKPVDKQDLKKALAELEGTWSYYSVQSPGDQWHSAKSNHHFKPLVIREDGRWLNPQGEGASILLLRNHQGGTLKIDPDAKPRQIDLICTSGFSKGDQQLGIYEVDGQTLKVCIGTKKRPTEFKPQEDVTLYVFKKRPAVAVADLQADSKLPAALESLLEKFSKAEYFWQQKDIADEIIKKNDKRVLARMEKYLDTSDRRRRCNAALVLAGLGDIRGLAIIIFELEDTEPRPTDLQRSDGKPYPEGQIREDRYYAALLLGQLRRKEAVPALIEATKDETISERAAMSLGEIGDRSAIPTLRKLAKDLPKKRLRAGYGLAALGEQEGFDLLMQMIMSDSEWTNRRHAVEALTVVGNPKAVPALLKALKDEHPEVRSSAAGALGKIGDAAAIPFLKEALKDTAETKANVSKTVAAEAQRAIESILKRK